MVDKSLELAKVPSAIIKTIERLTETWSSNAYLLTSKGNITTDEIKYKKGILQGDALSVILFILSVNPSSFLFNRAEGFEITEEKSLYNVFFVDDLKLYARSYEIAKLLLDIITTFSNDVGMTFGKSKCAHIYIEHGKRKSLGKSIKINGLTVRELEHGEMYTYLGQDESISYNGPLNKERVTNEYKRRVRKLWSSDLYSNNKITAHNTFAIPVITPTIGIINWTKQEIRNLDIATRKILTYTGSLHKRSDVDRLYVPRKLGGRGLTSVQDTYIIRTIALGNHLEEKSNSNELLQKVKEHEQDHIIRLSNEFKKELGITSLRITTDVVKGQIKRQHLEQWKQKPLHSYLFRRIEEQAEIDQRVTTQWMNTGISSHLEGYATALQEQEIGTRVTIKRRVKDQKLPTKCRLCKKQNEDVFHVVGSCPEMSSNLYTPARHNPVPKVILNEVIKEDQQPRIGRPLPVINTPTKEIWWDKPLQTPNKIEHNRPDIVIWDRNRTTCTVVEVGVPLDFNIASCQRNKADKYMPLISELQQMYPGFKYQVAPIILGALGTVPNRLKEELSKLNIAEDQVRNVIKRLKKTAIIGSIKIMKTFMKM